MKTKAALLAVLATFATADMASAQTAETAASCPADITPAATVEVATFQTRGRPIESLLVKPTGSANGAGIVMLHGSGGLHSDLPRIEQQVAQLASRGYHVLLPNYYSASNRSFRESPLITERWREVADNAVTFLGEVPGVSADRIGIWGFSLGGYLAVDSTLEDGPARAVVGVAAGNRVGRLGSGRHKAPVLLIAANQDPVVTIISVNEWADALRGRDVPVTVQTIQSAQHLFDPPVWCEVFEHTRTFFDAQLAPTAN